LTGAGLANQLGHPYKPHHLTRGTSVAQASSLCFRSGDLG